jgi:eukaryotic-like serine/threonine-protein kinase
VSTDPLPSLHLSRFELLRRLGKGAQGAVYEALDREQQRRVALKMIGLRSPDHVLRFKNEFRALRDVHHPNLVRLNELLHDSGQWFYTMELVDGVDLIQYIRGQAPTGASNESSTIRMPHVPAAGANITLDVPAMRTARAFDETRLRNAFAQLAAALGAIHGAGKVHRDLKPPNTLVDAGGRVVVIDFGVVAELAEPGVDRGLVVGTVAYMAPEQADAKPVGPAADWYAFGVLLFEALTGRRPFDGSVDAVLTAKRYRDAPSPSLISEGVPADLEALCMRLLLRSPDERAGLSDVSAVLSGDGATVPATLAATPTRIVGRAAELAALHAVWDEVGRGEARAVSIEGESGVGKSTLAGAFLEELGRRDRRLVVLRGRCDEQERVPYNAFDGIVDALARHLRGRSPSRLRRLIPPDSAALTRLFPVLGGLDGGDAAADSAVLHSERTRAFAALRLLLGRLAARRRLILVVDDIHWADSDSVALLTELLHQPGAAPLLLLATARSGGGGGPCPAIAALQCEVRRLPLAGLASADANELARAIVADRALAPDVDVARIVEETGGHPMFLDEMVHYVMEHPTGARSATLDDALAARVARQTGPAQRLLALAAAAGSPTPHAVLAEAMRMPFEEHVALVGALGDARLVRVGGMLPRELVEPYHDRVRESVYARLAPVERVELHGRLAAAFAAHGAAPDVLVPHLERAGRTEEAARAAEAAAAAATKAMAFGRAATMYERALALGHHAPDARHALLCALAEALARAGRRREAAETFLQAATGTRDEVERVDLTRRAAEQFLTGGHLETGLAAARDVLGTFGIKMPRRTAAVLAQTAWSQLRLETRRLSWSRRAEAEVEPRTARLLDAYWSLGVGLGLVESMLSGLFILRGALLSLDAGDETRISRFLSAAAMISSGLTANHRALRLVDACERAARSDGAPLSLVYGELARNMYRFFVENDWRGSIAGFERVRHMLAAAGRREGWEADMVEQFVCWALENLGYLDEIRARVPERIRAAQQAGNRFIEVNFRTYFVHVHLVPDRLDEARRDVEDAIASWPASSTGFGNQDYLAQRSLTYLALYAGEAEASAARLVERWQQYFRSVLSRVTFLRQDALWLFGALALARRRPREARWALSRLSRMTMPMAQAGALRLRAGLAAIEGDADGAVRALREALQLAERDDTQLVAACVQRMLGALVGGSEGAALRAASDAWMTARNIRNPARMSAAWMPGFDIGRTVID